MNEFESDEMALLPNDAVGDTAEESDTRLLPIVGCSLVTSIAVPRRAHHHPRGVPVASNCAKRTFLFLAVAGEHAALR